MNRNDMMVAISNTLKADEKIEIRVTNARGRTLVHHYEVTSQGFEFTRQTWGGFGNLRDTYRTRVMQ